MVHPARAVPVAMETLLGRGARRREGCGLGPATQGSSLGVSSTGQAAPEPSTPLSGIAGLEEERAGKHRMLLGDSSWTLGAFLP